jgi:uncharacterized protein
MIRAQVLRFALTLVVGYATLVLIFVAGQRYMLFRGWSLPNDLALLKAYSPGMSSAEIRTKDGETLAGFWKTPKPGIPVIISFHGNGSIPQPYADRFAQQPWADAGYGVLAIAFRGYPGSTGSPSEAGLLEDGQAAYDYARTHAPDSPIVVHGHSLGSGVAVAIAARNDVLALILDAPYTRLDHVAADKFLFLPTVLMLDKFRSDERIRKVKAKRIFIVHGTDDVVIPLRFGRKLASLRNDAVLMVIEGGGHESILGVADVAIERAITPLFSK